MGIAGSSIAFVVYLCKPTMVIGSRNGLRAMLLMPGDLRAFPVEEYARPGDEYSYTYRAHQNGIKRWALQIGTKAEHREHWQDQFNAYVTERKFTVARRYDRGSNFVLKGYTANRTADCWLSLEQSRTSDDLDMVFVYQTRSRITMLRRCIIFVDSSIRKLWYLFGEEPTIVDVRAS